MADIRQGREVGAGRRRGSAGADAAVRRRQVGPRRPRRRRSRAPRRRSSSASPPRSSRRSSAPCSARSPATTAGGSTTSFNWFYSVFSSIPYLLLILAVAAVLQQKGTLTIILILGLTGWTGMFRLIRAEYLKHKAREYVQAADAIGASNARRMFVHIFPNVAHVVLVQLSILTVGFIKAEVILSFLGFGVPVDVVSWGSMLNEAQNELILGKWWQLVAAGGTRWRCWSPRSAVHRCAARRARSEAQGHWRDTDDGRRSRTRSIRWSASATCGSRSASTASTTFEAVKGISFDIPKNTTVALVGESGSRQVGDLARDPRACCRRRTRSSIPASRSCYGGRNLVGLPPRELREPARRRHLDDLPGADDVAEPGVHRRLPARGGAAAAHGPDPAAGAQARDRAAGRGRHPRSRAARSTPTRRRCRAASSSA